MNPRLAKNIGPILLLLSLSASAQDPSGGMLARDAFGGSPPAPYPSRPAEEVYPDPIGELPPGTRTGPPTKLPTGVVLRNLPRSPGVEAHGAGARAFAAEVIFGDKDAPLPDDLDQPSVILVGPDDATRQVEQQLTASDPELLDRFRVNRYDPAEEGVVELIRRLGFSAGGRGEVKCMVIGTDREVAYEGVFELVAVVRAIKRLLGMEPDNGLEWLIDLVAHWTGRDRGILREFGMDGYIGLIVAAAAGFFGRGWWQDRKDREKKQQAKDDAILEALKVNASAPK